MHKIKILPILPEKVVIGEGDILATKVQLRTYNFVENGRHGLVAQPFQVALISREQSVDGVDKEKDGGW